MEGDQPITVEGSQTRGTQGPAQLPRRALDTAAALGRDDGARPNSDAPGQLRSVARPAPAYTHRAGPLIDNHRELSTPAPGGSLQVGVSLKPSEAL